MNATVGKRIHAFPVIRSESAKGDQVSRRWRPIELRVRSELLGERVSISSAAVPLPTSEFPLNAGVEATSPAATHACFGVWP